MKNSLNYQQIPLNKKEDYNSESTVWIGNRLASMNCGSYDLIYIGHYKETVDTETGTEEISYAWPIKVDRPVSRDKIINAAEMQAYNLDSALDVASFAVSLSRKYRENNNDSDVKAHDEFIDWVKTELDKSGFKKNNVNATGKVKQTQKGNGSIEDPYKNWKVGDKVVKGKWYQTEDGYLWEAIKSGKPVSTTDKEYFDIIGI